MTQKEFESLEVGDIVYNNAAIHLLVRILSVHESHEYGFPLSYEVQ